MSKNPLTLIMGTNKFNGTNYNDWLRNLRIVLDFENQGYVLDKPLPMALPEGSSPEERLTFDKWLEDNRKVRSIILTLMTNDIQNQYDRLDDVPLIMLCMKEAKGKKAGRWKRKKGKGQVIAATASAGGAPAAPTEKGKGKVGGSQRLRENVVCMHCQGKGHWKRECPQLLSNPGAGKKKKAEQG
ncbi:UNVERIFIED_CONTAM: hypothetical protein Slati_4409500, partial [Sesamum latifolium]